MQPLPLTNPDIRTCEEIRSVLADTGCTCEGPLYEMFRDVAVSDDDRSWLQKHHLRYDVTRIPGRIICGELVKTKGHYHPSSPDGSSYPEIYEVLEGRALYLIQKRDMSDIRLVHAKAGDLIPIPPGYGHVTINPQKSPLLMANLVSMDFSSDYRPYEEMRGAAYYAYADGSFGRNPRYPKDIPSLIEVHADGTSLPDGFPDRSLYDMIGEYGPLSFLNEPKKAEKNFGALFLYR
jgi:glucose-6-phosphate isomerase, archaeal